MNRIDRLFKEKKGNILSIYFTAGYPNLDSTASIIKSLADAGADMIEIGMPFSDPMADGPVIQKSNEKALLNGMNMKLLFNQLSDIRDEVEIPILLMGYLNPVVQFGIENFCRCSKESGIDGIILPDLPPDTYEEEYRKHFDKFNIYNILLITPQSSDDRIHFLDRISRGFIYMVSSSSVTGAKGVFSEEQLTYFKRINELGLINPCLTGFGISNNSTFNQACVHSSGGIIGSAFVKMLGEVGDTSVAINQFVKDIRG